MSNVVQKSRSTGRPPGFDRDRVIAAAQHLFWTKGLDGTSYEELTRATGLHRPSIHAAFGDKRGLFTASLARYLSDSAAMLSDSLSKLTLVDALSAFFTTDLALFITPAGGRGCYALGVTAEAARSDPELAKVAETAWGRLNDAIGSRIARAAKKELPRGLDQALTTDLILATHVTIATRARAGEPIAHLEARVTRFLALFTHEETSRLARTRNR